MSTKMRPETDISIHALRGEGDDINSYFKVFAAVFQSTPSVGRATVTVIVPLSAKVISIHALRGEGDV